MPVSAPEQAPPGGRGRTALWAGLVIVLIGAGAALAILLSGGGDSSRTTVLVDRAGKTTTVTTETEDTETDAVDVIADPPGPEVAPGLYVQAGSFRTVDGAEEERERLAAAGVDVSVISSDGAAELYPGFQVLFGGPIFSAAQERRLLKELEDNGVDGFGRDLSPAPLIGGASDAAGRWTGTLTRTSGERPNLNDELPVTVEIEPDGRAGTLETADGCSESLSLKVEGAMTLTYSQDTPCVSGGDVFVRPAGDELMVSMLPLGTDVFVTGGLEPS
ncbi:MAG TPA: SPOR domain-containing protein [Solirubrobacterales bacterium]|nr:SPOR domain-containing protein [Solirubrobacterales bacterium]